MSVEHYHAALNALDAARDAVEALAGVAPVPQGGHASDVYVRLMDYSGSHRMECDRCEVAGPARASQEAAAIDARRHLVTAMSPEALLAEVERWQAFGREVIAATDRPHLAARAVELLG